MLYKIIYKSFHFIKFNILFSLKYFKKIKGAGNNHI